MSAKDNAAVIQLFDLLESRYALRVIWALSDGHPQTFRLLQDSVGGVTPNTLNTRIKELRAARLVDHSGKGYKLTPHGAELARSLGELRTFASRWHQRNLLNARDGVAKHDAALPASQGSPRTPA